jgi:hypothetical protein
MREKGLICHDYYGLNGNKKINIWFWLIMSNILHLVWLLITCFDPPFLPLHKMLACTWGENNYMCFLQTHSTLPVDESTLCSQKMAFAP